MRQSLFFLFALFFVPLFGHAVEETPLPLLPELSSLATRHPGLPPSGVIARRMAVRWNTWERPPQADPHPLRAFVNCQAPVVHNHAGVQVAQGTGLLYEKTCNLTNAFPEAFRAQFATYDYATYPALYFTDRTYATDWAFNAMHEQVKQGSHPYYLFINKELDPKSNHCGFKVALKLPDTGPFASLNSALTEVIRHDVLKAIEDEFAASSDLDRAELAGVEKLTEIIKQIVGGELPGNLDEGMLLKMNFIEIPIDPAYPMPTTNNTGIQSLGDLLKDYAGVTVSGNQGGNVGAAMSSALGQGSSRFNVTLGCIITDNSNYTLGPNSDFGKATDDFDNFIGSKEVTIWVHLLGKNGEPTQKIFVKFANNLTDIKADAIVNSEYAPFRPPLAAKGNAGPCADSRCINSEFSTEWTALCGVLPCIENQAWFDLSNPLYLLLDPAVAKTIKGFSGGIVCGIIDGFIGHLSFFAQAGNFLSDANKHTPLTTAWLTNLVLNIIRQESISKGLEMTFQSDAAFWSDVAEAVKDIITGIGGIVQQLYNELKTFLEAVLFRGDEKVVGYYLGMEMYDFMIAVLTGGSSLAASYTGTIVRQLKGAINDGASGMMGIIRSKIPKGSNKWTECVLRGTGCFVAGTVVHTALGQMPIESIHPGDMVYANTWVNNRQTEYDEAKGIYAPTENPVTDWLTSEEQRLFDVGGYERGDFWAISLTLSQEDGRYSKATLLRPEAWMGKHQVCSVGNQVWLDMPETGMTGLATITALKFVGKLKKPEKNIEKEWALSPITGIFEHDSEDVWQIVFEGSDTLGVTGGHPFFSASRGMWVQAEGLIEGEKVLSRQDTKTLTSKTYLPGYRRVYNVEVAEWHNFLVGRNGIAVHNTGCFKALFSVFNINFDDILDVQGKTWAKKVRHTDNPLPKEIDASETIGDFYKEKIALTPESTPGIDAITENGKVLSYKIMEGLTVNSNITNLNSNISGAYHKYKKLPQSAAVKMEVWVKGDHATTQQIQQQWELIKVPSDLNMTEKGALINSIHYIGPNGIIDLTW